MSTLIEVQDAVSRLPSSDKKALRIWLESQTEPQMTPQEEQLLLHSLDQGMRDIDAGKGVSIDQVRQRVGAWAAK